MIINKLKALIILFFLLASINCWAKGPAASIAVSYNTGAYAYDKDKNLAHTAKDAVTKCEKMSKKLNKTNGWGYKEPERRCEVVAQLNAKQCISLATDGDGAFAWTISDGKRVKNVMRQNSIRECRMQGGRKCNIALELCTD